MNSPFDLDVYATHLRNERMREAQAERMARLAQSQGHGGLRPWLAGALHALADRVDSCACPTPAALDAAYARISWS